MIISALFGCVIMLTAAAMKKTTIGNTDDSQLKTLVNSTSTAAPDWTSAKDGQVLQHFKQIVSGASTPLCPMAAVF
jgi:hypothetical protein